MNIALFDDYRKEFKVDNNGVAYQSKRSLSKFCGTKLNNWGKAKDSFFNKVVDNYVIEELELDLHNIEGECITIVEALVSKGFLIVEGKRYFIQDVLSSVVIEFYANVKRTLIARQINRSLRAIGLRTAIQRSIGWNGSKDYGHLMRTSPRKWTKVFGDEFYDELSRLTNLPWDRKTHQTPFVFAHLTNEFVYKHLPKDVYKAIKDNQSKHNGYIQKVHQFLSDEGLELLHNHLTLTIGILSGASSLANARLAMHHAITRNYQGSLFVDA